MNLKKNSLYNKKKKIMKSSKINIYIAYLTRSENIIIFEGLTNDFVCPR